MRPIACFGLLMVTAITPAAATDVCMVQDSPDGFVALRAAPRPDGPLVVRAKPGEAVVIQKQTNGDQMKRGHWLHVLHFPAETVPAVTDPSYRKGRLGWMHRRYVNDCG